MNKGKRNNYYVKLICCFLLYIVSFSLVLKQAQMEGITDYSLHMSWVKDFFIEFPDRLTYPLWHIGVFLTHKLGQITGGMPIEYACAIFTSIINVVIYLIISTFLEKENVKKPGIIGLALCFMAPIYIPWYNQSLYLGQGSPTTWHNPTNMIVKPFAIIAVFLVIKMCDKIRRKEAIRFKEYLLLAVMAFFSVLAKPSFFQGFVPALGIYMVISLIVNRGKALKDYFCICVSFVPAFFVVLWQFAMSFYTGTEGGGIGIGWAEIMKIYTPNPWISLLLVLLFPLTYSVFNIKEVCKKISIKLSWLYIVVSWCEWAFLYENNSRKYDGNFGWAVQIAYLLIWIITSNEFFKELQEMEFDKKGKVIKNTVYL